MLKEHLGRMLAYHSWAQAQLIHTLTDLPDDDYFADQGLFFSSIHGTLNHIALGDALWLGRLSAEPYPVTRLDQPLADDLAGLTSIIASTLEQWQAWFSAQEEFHLFELVSYRSMAGTPGQRRRADLISHALNHATHHRGQISAALTAMGYPAPELDLLYAPQELLHEYPR